MNHKCGVCGTAWTGDIDNCPTCQDNNAKKPDLRERAEDIMGDFFIQFGIALSANKSAVNLIEQALIEVRNETIEQCAKRLEVLAELDGDYGGSLASQKDLRWLCASMLRANKSRTGNEGKV